MIPKRISILLIALIACAVTFMAYAESDGTTITINSNVTLPVTVKPNGGSAFTLHQRNYTTSTRISDAVFTDGNGNRCMYDHRTAHVGGNVHHYYTVTRAYTLSSSSSYDNGGSYSSNDSSGKRYVDPEFSDAFVSGMNVYNQGHPFLALGAGMSMSCGEFIRAKITTGGLFGLLVSASVGKDCFFDEEYSNKISWNAGLGLRFGSPNTDYSVNVLLGRTPWHPDLGVICNFEVEHFFGRAKRFGIFGNIGVAAYDLGGDGKDAKAHFDFMAGVAIKLWQK